MVLQRERQCFSSRETWQGEQGGDVFSLSLCQHRGQMQRRPSQLCHCPEALEMEGRQVGPSSCR